MADLERIRLVILGGAGVGKSSILKRFLFKTYTDKYRATVEDLYNREYDLGGVTLKVDILDTSGEMQFPAMRRLSIATAHAFLLVYATTSGPSFQCVKQCFEEIREQRADFQDIPIVIAGNKSDLAKTHREVKLEEVTDWVYCELPRLRAKVLECSAKEDNNVTDLFKTMLSLSRFLPVGSSNEGTSGLKRRSSAYVSASSSRSRFISPEVKNKVLEFYKSDDVSVNLPGKKDFISVRNDDGQRQHMQKRLILCNLKELYKTFKGQYPNYCIGFSIFASLRPQHCVLAGSSGTHTICVCATHQNIKLMMLDKNRNASPSISSDKKSSLVDAVDPATSSDAKLKPRSRSLIRRASRKTKQQINNASDDCNLQ